MDSPPGSARSSPEAEVGMRVEDLWDIQEPQLRPSEKLNSCFESLPVSSFPPTPSSQGKVVLDILRYPVFKTLDRKANKVSEDESVLKAFQLMRKRRVGALPVFDKSRTKAIGNISIRDVHHLLTAPEIFKDYRCITTMDFITIVKSYMKEQGEDSPDLLGVITCTRDDTVKDVILMLDAEKIQRVYVVDKDENLRGVVTLRDIISRLVHKPNGYFGDFFDGIVPLPENSRVRRERL